MKPTYEHLNGITICTLRDKSNNTVQGIAQCHPDEKNESDRVGEYIATMRAEIKYYKLMRRIELMPQIKTLNHLLACMLNTGSKVYNPDSPEISLIRRQLWMVRSDYDAMGELIIELEKALKEYLANREKITGQI